ncbi:MAG: AraC family transcriptional regulator [Candidatus Pelagadaptatus aseana]|uniref:AraC family transcriptional regulator n=1 Tax=Candidatus Pelagadaptatus aseana TaxID=3120508 RepID=UPI0039B15E91
MKQNVLQYSTPSWHSFELQKLLLRLQREQGVAVETVLQGTGVDQQFLEDPTRCVTVEQELAVYIRIANLNRDPLFAFHHGRSMGLSQWGLLGQAMLSSQTVLDALRLFTRFVGLFSWQMQVSLQALDHGGYALTLLPTPVDETTQQFEVESSFAALHTLLEDILVDRVTFQALAFATPVFIEVLHYFEGAVCCDVAERAGANRVEFAAALVQRPLPYADPEHLALLEALCRKHLRQLAQEQDLLGAVNGYLNSCEQLPSIEAVASHFSMSSRTLRRRLTALGCNFQHLLDDHRYGLAREFLQDETMSLEAVAKALSYSDVRSFRQAFKRWSGMAPGQFRSSGSS